MVVVAVAVLAAWVVATVLLASVLLDWTGSLLVAVPAALCVTTGAGLLLARPPRR